MEWYLAVVKKYTEFSGRARRKEYWMFALINVIITIAVAVIEGFVGSFGILGGIYALGLLLPSLAVSVRRLHDTNRSGWWLLIALIPLLGTLALLYFLVSEGENAENEYGANPKVTAAL